MADKTTGKLKLWLAKITDKISDTINIYLSENFSKIDDEFSSLKDGVDEHKADDASTTTKGHVQLSSSTSSTSTSLAATASAVKTVNDALTSHKADDTKHITFTERTIWNSKQDAIGYTPVNKAGDTMTGDLKVNGNVVAGTELIVGYNGTTESLQRFKFKYNGSTGYLELWRYSNDTGWTLCVTFPNRNQGSGGLTIEGKQVAYKSDIPTKLSEFTKDINFDERYYTESEVDNKLNSKVDKVDGKGLSTEDYTTAEKNKLSGIQAGAQVNTVTSVNGQIGDIELTGDDLDYFDYDVSQYRNVGITLNEINDKIFAFMAYIIGAGYDIDNDPTLKEILEMLTIILGDYELGIAPSLGEIVEEMKSNKITIGKTQPNSGWWFEEID